MKIAGVHAVHRIALVTALLISTHTDPLAHAQVAPRAVRAGAVTARVNIARGTFRGMLVRNPSTTQLLSLPEAFTLVMKDGSVLRSTQMQVRAIAAASVIDPHEALRGPARTVAQSQKACWQFQKDGRNATVQWCLAAGHDYIREVLRIAAQGNDQPIAEVRLLDFADPAAHVEGTVRGSPIVDGHMYFGVEHPLSTSVVAAGQARASMFRELPLRAGTSVTYSAVLGTARPGEMRRSFLAYIEAERPRPYQPFLHYNSWYDLGFGNRFDEAGALDRIHAFGDQLATRRGVTLDSFLFDDGWDDTHSLWGFNSGFPHGFTSATAAAKQFSAGVGVWMSPWGGYSTEKKERIAYGTAHHLEIVKGGYALSGPTYYKAFEATCLQMIAQYDVNQFKFDGTGNVNSVYPGSEFDSDFDAAIHLIETLRKAKPSIFINLTTGTTASPFWLFYADSIWRGGDDHFFAGEGTARQRWITYRDAMTYENIVKKGPLFPLNSLMLHGLIYAAQAKDLGSDPGHDFADEVHSYFASGTQLQEMYLTPSLLSASDWDTLADAAKWSRANAATLKDTHWVGGDPGKGEVYGWAAWSPAGSFLTLRNPAAHAQTLTINVADTLQISAAASTNLVWKQVWPDSAGNNSGDSPDGALTFSLEPFEVRTLQAGAAR